MATKQQYADPKYKGPSNFEMGLSALGKGLGGLATTGNPYVAAGMAALDVYQGFKNQDAAEEQLALQREQYNDQMNANRAAEEERKKNQVTQDIFTGSNFATSLQDDLQKRYGDYWKNVGR